MAYQQGTQRIEIIVRKENGAVANEEGNAEGAKITNGETVSTSRAVSAKFLRTNITHGISVARHLTNELMQWSVSGIGYQTGDSSFQQYVSRQLEVASDIGNFVTSIGMGAAYGSAGGPVGAILGATFMGAQTAINTSFKYLAREREYTVAVFKQENAIEYQRSRANINLTTGRLR